MTSITGRVRSVGTGGEPGRRRGARGRLAAGFRALRAESLFRNSAFLVMSLAVTSLGGFGALSLLARLYSVRAVGLAAVAMTAVGFVSSTVQFGMNYSLPRFLPTSANRAALINTVVTVTVLAACAGSALFLVLPFASKLYALGAMLFIPIFIIVTCLSAVSNQLQNVLIADRSSGSIVGESVAFSLTKLATPAIFLFLGIAGAFVAQSVAVLVAVAFLAVVIARSGHQFRPALNLTATRDLIRFSAGAYLGTQVGGLPLMVLPFIILSRFGASQNAYWYIALAIGTLLSQLAGSVAKAMLPETSHRPAERKMLIRRSAVLIGSVMAPVLLIAYFAAPFVLTILGHRYDIGALAPLRWLIIGAAITSFNYLTGNILYIAKKAFTITVINAVDAVVVIGLAAMWAHSTTEIAICWVVGEISNTVLFGACAVRAFRQVHGRWEALGGDDIEP